jgi:hypothetical protein
MAFAVGISVRREVSLKLILRPWIGSEPRDRDMLFSIVSRVLGHLAWPMGSRRLFAAIIGCSLLAVAFFFAWQWRVQYLEGVYAESLQFYEAGPQIPARPTIHMLHDFGIVGPATPCVHTFQIKNESKDIWNVVGIQASCSCTVPRVSAKSVAPGGTLLVAVSYRPLPVDGVDKRPVQIHFAEASAPLIVLVVAAEVKSPLSVPTKALEFSEASAAVDPVRTFDVFNNTDRDWGRVATTTTAPWLCAESCVVPANSGNTAHRQQWRVSVQAKTKGLTSGRHDAVLTIICDDPTIQPKNVAVGIQIASPLRVIPDQLFYGEIERGIPHENRISLWFSPGCAPQLPEEIAVSHALGDQLAVRCERKSEDCWVLKAVLTVAPESEEEFVRAQVRLKFANGRIPPTVVPLSAKVRRAKS